MPIKRLTNLFLLRGRLFNLRLWFWEVFLSFLWWLLCCVMVDIPIFSSFFFSPILILFFIFLRLVRSLSKMKKKIHDGSTGNQGMIIKWAELWIKLKIGTLKIYWFSNFSSQYQFTVKQQFKEKKENHQTRRYHLIEHHILKDIVITLVWQTAERIDLNILRGKRTYPFQGGLWYQ